MIWFVQNTKKGNKKNTSNGGRVIGGLTQINPAA